MGKIKVKNNKKENFYTAQEIQEIKEKMSGIKIPNDYRNMKVIDLISEFGRERAKKLIEEEVYLFKNSMILVEMEESYGIINGNENDMINYIFKNQNEVMRNSMYEFLGVGVGILS